MRTRILPPPLEPPLTTREMLSWTFYAFASEAYVVVALTSFLPLTLESMAEREGLLYPDLTEPCISPNATTIYSDSTDPARRCVLPVGPFNIDTASFVLYLTSLAVFLQALTVGSISAMADHGSFRKKQLLVFSVIGSSATMLIGLVSSVWVAGALSVIANVSFGASIVCFNAYLPLLVRNDVGIRTRQEDINADAKRLRDQSVIFEEQERGVSSLEVSRIHAHSPQPTNTAAVPLEHQQPPQIEATMALLDLEKERVKLEQTQAQLVRDKSILTAKISARGFASGYLGGVLLLIVCLAISYYDKGSSRSLKFGIFLSGLWWFLFTGPAALWLGTRPGGELELDTGGKQRGSLWVSLQYVKYSWARVGTTLARARKLPNAFAFLAAWFMLSDGYSTVANVALLFAKTSLHLPQSQLILLSLIVPICALVGTLVFPRLQAAGQYTQKQMVMLLLIMLAMVPLYGVLGLILPFWPHLTTSYEVFAIAIYFGLLVGAIQSYCRSIYSELIPRGQESRFFGLYALTDKASSFIGPMSVAAITDATHEIRNAFIFLLVLLSVPIPIMYFFVDPVQGRIDADKESPEAGEESGDEDRPEVERLLP